MPFLYIATTTQMAKNLPQSYFKFRGNFVELSVVVVIRGS